MRFDATPPVDSGLPTLEEGQLELMRALDGAVLDEARRSGARELGFPPLIEVSALSRIDYFRNFPHLGLAVAPLRPELLAAMASGEDQPADSLDCAKLAAPRYLLPSAACYPVYQHFQGRVLDAAARITTLQRCFRNETAFEGLARLLGFTMREVVCLGTATEVRAMLAAWRAWITALAERCAVPLAVQTASDPFFESASSRARMQQLFPVKEEFVFEGHVAVASLNLHRNFFAERWNIRTEDGEWAHSGCVAFGLERWVHALSRCHGGDIIPTVRTLRASRPDPT